MADDDGGKTCLLLSFLLVNIICAISAGLVGSNSGLESVPRFPDPTAETQNEEEWILTQTQPIEPANISQIHYYLYTKDNPTEPDEILVGDIASLEASHYQANGNLKILVHGFGGNFTHGFPREMKNELLNLTTETNNVITVDWSHLATGPEIIYPRAYYFAYVTAKRNAELINFLINQNVTSPSKVHLIGYSLGGQVVGITGHAFKNTTTTGLILNRVTALDPAKPFFEIVIPTMKVSPGSAKFVDVIHTAAGIIGVVNPVGHVDFYPNGGVRQPGCGFDLVGGCAHGRAVDYFQESISSSNRLFGSCECKDWYEFDVGNCLCTNRLNLGYWLDHSVRGKYFLRTNSERPYAMDLVDDSGEGNSSGSRTGIISLLTLLVPWLSLMYSS